MQEIRTDFRSRETERTGRGTYPSVKFVFRDGRQRLVRYGNMQDIEYYPANAQRFGSDMEAIGIETMERKIVIKGYNLESLFGGLEHRSVDEISETRETNILADKRSGEPVYVSIDIRPLLFDNAPDLPDFMKFLNQPQPARSEPEHIAVGYG